MDAKTKTVINQIARSLVPIFKLDGLTQPSKLSRSAKHERIVEDILGGDGSKTSINIKCIRTVSEFKRVLVEIYNLPCTNGMSLKSIHSVCDKLDSFMDKIEDAPRLDMKVFLRAVVRATMRISIHVMLFNPTQRCYVSRVCATSFKIAYSLLSPNNSFPKFKINTLVNWLRAAVIVANIGVVVNKKKLIGIKSFDSLTKYFTIDKLVTEHPTMSVSDIIYYRKLSINEKEIRLFEDYVACAWEEYYNWVC